MNLSRLSFTRWLVPHEKSSGRSSARAAPALADEEEEDEEEEADDDSLGEAEGAGDDLGDDGKEENAPLEATPREEDDDEDDDGAEEAGERADFDFALTCLALRRRVAAYTRYLGWERKSWKKAKKETTVKQYLCEKGTKKEQEGEHQEQELIKNVNKNAAERTKNRSRKEESEIDQVKLSMAFFEITIERGLAAIACRPISLSAVSAHTLHLQFMVRRRKEKQTT